jgi:hypothetical protein
MLFQKKERETLGLPNSRKTKTELRHTGRKRDWSSLVTESKRKTYHG